MTESWKAVPGYEGYYEVSDLGNVRSVDRVVPCSRHGTRTLKGKRKNARPLGHRDKKNRYLAVTLVKYSAPVTKLVHVLVLEAFIGPRPGEAYQACHRDGNEKNNALDNLRWGTISENNLDRVKHGTHHEANKTECPLGHKLQDPNVYYRKDQVGRECLSCRRAKALAARHKKVYGKEYDIDTLCHEYYAKIMRGFL